MSKVVSWFFVILGASTIWQWVDENAGGYSCKLERQYTRLNPFHGIPTSKLIIDDNEMSLMVKVDGKWFEQDRVPYEKTKKGYAGKKELTDYSSEMRFENGYFEYRSYRNANGRDDPTLIFKGNCS